MRSLLAAVALVAVAPFGAAQFSQFEWTIDNGAGCLVIEGSNQVIFGGGNSFGGPTTYATTLGYDAFVSVHIATVATPKGDCGDSHALFGTWQNLSVFADCSSAQVMFNVPAGGSIVFGHDVLDNTLPGDSIFSGLIVRPYWLDLNGGLAGAAGAPTLEGQGLPLAGGTIHLGISDAAPSAPTTLVLGFTQASLPFKGGVLVPAPNVLLPGLLTGASGDLLLAGTWPSGLPAGFAVLMQAWIVDAGGPKGFAATNAVEVFSA